MTASEQVTDALANIPEVLGCAVLRPDRIPEPGWQVFPLADGRRVRVDFASSTSQATIDQVRGIVAGLAPQVLTPSQDTRRRAKQLARSSDPQAVLLRATLRVLYQAIKECRDRLGLPSRTWEQLRTVVEQQIEAGGGDA